MSLKTQLGIHSAFARQDGCSILSEVKTLLGSSDLVPDAGTHVGIAFSARSLPIFICNQHETHRPSKNVDERNDREEAGEYEFTAGCRVRPSLASVMTKTNNVDHFSVRRPRDQSGPDRTPRAPHN